MSRDFRLYLEDILVSVEATHSYLEGANRKTLDSDGKTRDAVIRCLEVIGEAVKRLPPDIVWDAATREVPLIGARVRTMLDDGQP